jgi:hypothetical protein
MPMVCFFPWVKISEPLVFGSFRLAPFGHATTSGEIPAELNDGIGAVLEAYSFRRDVHRASVPVLRHERTTFTADLSDEEVAEYFEFRTRLTFTSLAARQFFGHRYCNSDNVRLVIQGFTPERAGGALITTRRRDGGQRTIAPRGSLHIPRPMHVAASCDLPRDLDSPLLQSLETALQGGSASWPQLADAIRLFVGANTDSDNVGLHAELIDTVSAFSRLADKWDERGTVGGFLAVLPPPGESDAKHYGPKAGDARLKRPIAEGKAVREVWLADAYRLRGQYGHGHVATPPYNPFWSIHEHLLLAAVALPLMVKAMLAREGFYKPTAMDVTFNDAFDTLATLEPFALTEERDEQEEEQYPWRDTLTRASLRPLAARLGAALQAQIDADGVDERQVPERDTLK